MRRTYLVALLHQVRLHEERALLPVVFVWDDDGDEQSIHIHIVQQSYPHTQHTHATRTFFFSKMTGRSLSISGVILVYPSTYMAFAFSKSAVDL